MSARHTHAVSKEAETSAGSHGNGVTDGSEMDHIYGQSENQTHAQNC